MKKAELVFIPAPVMGHIAQAVELANLMIDRDDRLSVTVLVMKLPIDPVGTNFIESFASQPGEQQRIRFLHLPTVNPNPEWNFKTLGVLLSLIIEHHKPHVRDVVAKITRSELSSSAGHPAQLAGFVVDMLCTPMIDVADEFGVPAYIFFTSNAAFLGLMLYFQTLHDDHNQDIAEFKHVDTELVIPSFANPVPPAVLPFVLLDKQSWTTRFLQYARGYRKAKAIIINTFSELESHALNCLSSSSSSSSSSSCGIGKTPPIYHVGPILNKAQIGQDDDKSDLMEWLDDQPPSSVVFLCFGSMGGFGEEQVKEIAQGVERSGYRFLWSLRKSPPKGKVEFPGEYEKQGGEVLPEGFLDRTAGRGKVVNGWVRQLVVLSHRAVGGFVSHCGWNSILESLWCGVPIATWPVYAEQQINAFQLVRELGLAVEISLDYHQNISSVMNEGGGGRGAAMVTAAEIESGIRRLMAAESSKEVRKKVKEMAEKCRMATREVGSSYTSLGCLLADFFFYLNEGKKFSG